MLKNTSIKLLALLALIGSAEANVNVENYDYDPARDVLLYPGMTHNVADYRVEFTHPTGNFNIVMPAIGNTNTHAGGPVTGYTSIKVKNRIGTTIANCNLPDRVGVAHITANIHYANNSLICNVIGHN